MNQTKTTYGYGFQLETDLSPKITKVFLMNHSISIIRCFSPTLADTLISYSASPDDSTDELHTALKAANMTFMSVITDIMFWEAKINFESHMISFTKTVIVFCPSYPWSMSKIEKHLTKHKLHKIMSRYCEELNGSELGHQNLL